MHNRAQSRCLVPSCDKPCYRRDKISDQLVYHHQDDDEAICPFEICKNRSTHLLELRLHLSKHGNLRVCVNPSFASLLKESCRTSICVDAPWSHAEATSGPPPSKDISRRIPPRSVWPTPKHY